MKPDEIDTLLRNPPVFENPKSREARLGAAMDRLMRNCESRAARSRRNWLWRLRWAGLFAGVALTVWAGVKYYKIQPPASTPLKNVEHLAAIDENRIETPLVMTGNDRELKSADLNSTATEAVRRAVAIAERLNAPRGQVRNVNYQPGSRSLVYTVLLDDGRLLLTDKGIRPADGISINELHSQAIPWVQLGRVDARTSTPWRIPPNQLLDEAGNLFTSPKTQSASELPLHEIPALIRQGKGKLIETLELTDGKRYYLYEFTLSNGERFIFGNADKPLPKK